MFLSIQGAWETWSADMSDKLLHTDLVYFRGENQTLTTLSDVLTRIKQQFQQMHKNSFYHLDFDTFANISDVHYMQMKPL